MWCIRVGGRTALVLKRRRMMSECFQGGCY